MMERQFLDFLNNITLFENAEDKKMELKSLIAKAELTMKTLKFTPLEETYVMHRDTAPTLTSKAMAVELAYIEEPQLYVDYIAEIKSDLAALERRQKKIVGRMKDDWMVIVPIFKARANIAIFVEIDNITDVLEILRTQEWYPVCLFKRKFYELIACA